MTETVPEDLMLLDPADTLDPLADAEDAVVKNRAKVGSARPSSLLYTYGPGAIMDLPGFSVMPAGLDDWEPIWKRREHIPTIIEPRLLNVARTVFGEGVLSGLPRVRPQRVHLVAEVHAREIGAERMGVGVGEPRERAQIVTSGATQPLREHPRRDAQVCSSPTRAVRAAAASARARSPVSARAPRCPRSIC